MIQRLQGRVENLTIVNHVADSLDLCQLRIDFDEVYIYGDSDDFMQYVGQDVVYTLRPDVINGEVKNVVCEIAVVSTVQTVQSIENIKLVPGRVERTICNFSSKGIRFGEFYPGCIALMSGHQMGSSSKAKWFDCSMIDQDSRTCIVRLFSGKDSTELKNILDSFIGSYVRFDLEATRYGLQTKEISVLSYSVELSPEVTIAKEVLKAELTKDVHLAAYDKYTNLLETLSTRIDGEPGYTLVRMASEIYMINAIDAISADLDIQAMKRAVFCSRGYCTSHNKNWSKPMLNTNRALKVPGIRDDSELLYILDVMCEEEASPTKLTYIKIRNLVNDIINIRRGVINEKDNIAVGLSDVVRNVGGLL